MRRLTLACICGLAFLVGLGYYLYAQATSQHVITANANTMVIGYIAPNSAACTEQAASDPGFSTILVNQTGASGLRWRYFTVIGLSPQLTYYYRTVCGGNTVSGQFTMPAASGSAGVKLNFTAAPMTNIGSVDGLRLEWGQSPGSLTTTQNCTCTSAGCTVQFGSGTNINQDTTYFLRYKWTLAGSVKATSSVVPVAVRAGYASGSTLAYTSPTCLSPGPPNFTYSTGTALNGWNGSGAAWACGSYPTSTAPTLPAAGCPTSTSTTNACTAGYSTSLTDPDTGNRILRVTQNGSLNNTATGNQFYSFASGWRQAWNANSTKFLLMTDYGCYYDWVGFNPDSMTLTGESAYLPCKSEWNFSSTDPDLLYMMGSGWLQSYRISTGVTTNIKQWSADPYWVAGQSIVGMYIGGSTACVYSGTPGSGTGKLVGCHNVTSGQSWVIDTNVGTINGVSISGVTTSGNTGLHSVAVGRDGNYVLIDTGWGSNSGCATDDHAIHAQLMVNLQTGAGVQIGNYCWLTHWAIGLDGDMYSAIGSRPALCSGFDERGVGYRSYTAMNPVPFTEATGCYSGASPGITSSTHISWLNNRAGAYANKYPVLADQWNAAGATSYQCMGCNELTALTAYSSIGASSIHRFGQTWKTGGTDTPAGCADYIYRTSVISPDGRYALFSSDWKGGTGTGGPCGGGRRQDLFIMELK